MSALLDGQLDEELGDDVPVGPFARLQEAALGVEDRGRGVPPAPVDGVDRCAVRSAEELGLAEVGDDPHRHGQTLRHPVNDVPDCVVEGREGDAGVPSLAEGLGPDVPHLPGRPARLEDVDHTRREFVPTFVPPSYLPVSTPWPRPARTRMKPCGGRSWHRHRHRPLGGHRPQLATGRAALAGCAARACRDASRGWPAGPRPGTRSAWAPGRGRPGTTQRADAGGW